MISLLIFSSKITDNGLGNINKLLTGQSQKAPQRPVSSWSPTEKNALTNITICYYLGDDVEKSHLQFNPQWKFSRTNLNGLFTYINQLTLGTNILLGKYENQLLDITVRGALFTSLTLMCMWLVFKTRLKVNASQDREPIHVDLQL